MCLTLVNFSLIILSFKLSHKNNSFNSEFLFQLVTGILLIIKERFDLNKEDDHEWCDRLNNLTVMFVFIILIVNVFVSSFGVDIMSPTVSHHHHNFPSTRILPLNVTDIG